MSLATLTGTLHLMKALSGQPDVAVLQDTAYAQNDSVKTEVVEEKPFKLTLENSPGNTTDQALQFQRIKLMNDNFGVEYDFNKTKNDIARISLKDKNIGLNLYNVGNLDGKDIAYWEAWKEFNEGKNSFLIDVGTGHGKTTLPQYFVIGRMSNDKTFLEAGIFNESDKLFQPDKSLYGYAGYDFGDAYVGVGKNPDKYVGIAGIKGFEDLGNLTYALYNPETKSWNIKSQTSFKNANQKFFNKELFDYAGELFSVPPFFPVHFSPVMTKGDVTMKLMGNGDDKKTELEAMVGIDNAIIPFGIGVNNLSKDGKNNTNFALELYKGFKAAGLDGYIEARYNARTGDINGYIVLNYQLR